MKIHTLILLLLMTGGANAAQLLIGTGTTANDGTGDPLKTAFTKVNTNFTELYSTRLSAVPSAHGVNLVSAANYAAMRALLDLEPGTDFLSTAAVAADYQPISSNLTSWSAVAPSAYLTTSAAASGYQPLAANLTSWAAVAPSAYLSTSAAASGYQPLDADLTVIGGLADPNADRLLGWDDSAGVYIHYTLGTGLSTAGTTINATSTFDTAANYTLSGTWNYTAATVTFGTFSATTLNATNLQISGAAVTSSAAEVNVLDGVAAGLTAAELSILDGIPAGLTATELGVLDGIPAGLTAAELGVLDGIPGTLTATEIGYSDGVTSSIQTQIDAKAANAGTQTGVHATPSTTTPLSPTWTGPMHTVWYGATGTVNLPAAAGYTGRGIMIYNTGSFTVTVDANASEVLVRDGTVQTGGVSLTLSSGAGNFVALLSDGDRWVTLGYKGTLAVGS